MKVIVFRINKIQSSFDNWKIKVKISMVKRIKKPGKGNICNSKNNNGFYIFS